MPRAKKPAEDRTQGKIAESVRIPAATYNAMWVAYQETPSVRAVARKIGVSKSTAEHYITGRGAPDLGMEPIRERWLRVQAAAQEEQELNVLILRRGEIDWARKQLTTLHGEMEMALADVRRRVQTYQATGGAGTPERELGLLELVNAYDKAVRTAEHLLGGPDMTVEKRQGFDPLDALDEDEAMAYATTGVLPDSVRLAVANEIPRKSKGPR